MTGAAQAADSDLPRTEFPWAGSCELLMWRGKEAVFLDFSEARG